MELLNALVLLLNYTIVPAITYGSQLALGAIFATLVYDLGQWVGTCLDIDFADTSRLKLERKIIWSMVYEGAFLCVIS